MKLAREQIILSRPSTSTNDGQWHYALVTNDGSFVLLYADGSQIGSRSTSGASPDNLGIQPVRIGANSQAANSFFVGNADEIRIWNRALSSEEVAKAYDGNINTSVNTFLSHLFHQLHR